MVVKCKKLPNDFVEDVTAQFKLELQRPYLLYQNRQGEVNGIWFEKDDECLAINRLLEDLIRKLQQAAPIPVAAHQPAPPSETDGDMSKVLQMLQLGGKAPAAQPQPQPASASEAHPPMARILNMLTRAPSGPAPPPQQPQQPAYPSAVPSPYPPPQAFPQHKPAMPLAPQDLAPPPPVPHPGMMHHPHMQMPPPHLPPPPPQRVPVAPSREQLKAALQRAVLRDDFLDMLANEIAKEVGAAQGSNGSTL